MCSTTKKDIKNEGFKRNEKSLCSTTKKDIKNEGFKRNEKSLEERLLNLKKLVSEGVTVEEFAKEIKEIIEIANSPLLQLEDLLKKQVTIPLTSYIDERTTNMNNNIIKGIDGLMDKGEDIEVLIVEGVDIIRKGIKSDIKGIKIRIDAIDAPRRLQ